MKTKTVRATTAEPGYSSRNWWTELAIFWTVTLLCTFLLILLWIVGQDGTDAEANILWFALPGILVGHWASRHYRRRYFT